MGCTSAKHVNIGGKVLITGITGYVGSHVGHAFLRDGNFQVKGAVRDPTNQTKLEPLKKAYGENLYAKLELAKIDLMDAASIDKAVEGCDYIVHVASPFPMKDPENEDEIVKPAVEGTLAVMRAAHKHKVKRVVVTSSCLTIFLKKPENVKAKYTEEDWSEC